MIHGDVPQKSGGTLPPPEWTSAGAGAQASVAPPAALTRRSGTRADEAWLRARVEEARASADTTALRGACTALARWLASRERNLDEAVELATTALSLGVDGELRREVSAWLESLGEPARAAGVLRPLTSAVEGEEAEAAYFLIRAGTLKARAGAAGAAAAAFEAAMSIDSDDPLPAELFAGLAAWEPDAVPVSMAADAYVEAARRHALRGQSDAELEDLWRAAATYPESELAARSIAGTLELRQRPDAADEVWRGYATAVFANDPVRAAATHGRRRAAAEAAGDRLRALGVALDQESDCTLDPGASQAFDALLLDLGLVDVVAARVELRAETAGSPSQRSHQWLELARICAGPLADPGRAVAAYAAALTADPRSEAASTALQAYNAAVPRSTDDANLRTAAARAWARAATAEDVRQRATALERMASVLPAPVRAVFHAAASDRYRMAGERGASRRAAEAAVHADPENLRAAVSLAEAVLGDRDDAAAVALERAIALVGPRTAWCFALADARDALGESEAAVAWCQRCVTLRPADQRALEKLLDRLVRTGDAARLGDALAWVLSQPLPLEAIVTPFARTLRDLARLDADRAAVVARRALDVFGPKSPVLRDAMIDVAGRASDVAFTAAVYERWLGCGAEGVDRRRLFIQLADLCERLGDEEGEARVVARALRESVSPLEVEAHLDRMAGRPALPDAQLWRMEADALRASRGSDPDAVASAWRDFGAGLWDLAEDRVGAIAAWRRAARAVRTGGHSALAVDLVAFGGADFAFAYLGRLIDGESDDRGAAAIAAEAARAALWLGEPRIAFDFGARGVGRCPWYGAALEVAEIAASRSKDHPALTALYELIADRALGRFGRRAAHYRAARFFEREGEVALALKHAARSFQALPSEGSSLHLLARAADRAGDRAQAVRAIEQVADDAPHSEVRAAWLLRAASVTGDGPDGIRRKVDVLLRAVIASPTVASIALLRDSASALLAIEPDERDALEMRFARAGRTVTERLGGPQGARLSLAFAQTALEVFDDADTAMSALERAFACDADIEEFAVLMVHGNRLAGAADAATRIATLIVAGEGPHANVGAPALRVLAAVAGALGDHATRARAVVAAAARDPDDDALVLAADEAVRSAPDLEKRLTARVPPSRRAAALLSAARGRASIGAHAEAAALFERAVPLVDGATRSDVERALRAAWDASGLEVETERRVRQEAVSDEATPKMRADRWMEVADRREARGDAGAAMQAVLEACRLDPSPLERWSTLERLADLVGADETRVSALEHIVARVGPDGRVPALKRLARAYERRDDHVVSQSAWSRVLDADPNDEEASQAVESSMAAQGRHAELAEHLAVRAARLSSEPGSREVLRAVRLRRAVILEQRLGRVDDACEELGRLLRETPDHTGALRYLADLLERQGAFSRSAPMWLRAAQLEHEPQERADLEVRAGRASLASGDPAAALRLAKQAAERMPESRAASDLRVDAARGTGDDVELGAALESLAQTEELSAIARSDLLVEAAIVAARTGDVDGALDRSRRAAEVAPDRATPQLLARGLEYRFRGAGAPDEARQTIDDLAAIQEPVAPDDAALRSFLRAEALDAVQGRGEGLRELEGTRAMLGDHPLVALGLAERYASQGQMAAAVDAYRAALSGPLLDLRKPARVALAAASAAVKARRPTDAAYFFDLAEKDESVRGAARAARASALLGSRASAASIPITSGPDRREPDLEHAARHAVSSVERARARLTLGRRRLELGDAREAEPLLWDALADGSIEAGDALASLLGTTAERSRDLVRARLQQVALEAGAVGRLEDLRRAALADDARVIVRAVEHVLRALDAKLDPLPPPPLSIQPEQPGLLSLLTRPSADAAGEVLALLWEGAMQIFVRDAASYAITGVERIVPGPASPLAKLYEVTIHALDAPRIPLFVPRAAAPGAPARPSSQVAILSPPSVILTGDLREETADMRYALGRGMSAALPPNVLCLGLPPAEGRALVSAVRAAFGSPDEGRGVDSRAARLAESFWQLVPARAQRRLQLLLAAAPLPEYEELAARAVQSGRRVGMFVCGDFGFAARDLLADTPGLNREPLSLSNLRAFCQAQPLLGDLLRLAVSPEYAEARWHAVGPVSPRGAMQTGRFTLS
jgi:tetratricopeptide (TPR) repeat protein